MRTFLTLVALTGLLQQPPVYSPIQDGEAHGDPPYILEAGWEPLLNGKDLAGWKACEAGAKNEWYTTSLVRFEPFLGPTQLNGRRAPSGVILNGPTGRTANLCTERTFGDVEVYLEFMLAKGSNSGVYLHGLYEIQIFDSWGSIESMKTSDGGAIYHRWIENRGVGGSPPLVNASRRPGEWQSYQAWFRAPRVDATAGTGALPARALQRRPGAEGCRARGGDARGAGHPRSGAEPPHDPGGPRSRSIPEPLRSTAQADRPALTGWRRLIPEPPWGSLRSAAPRCCGRTLQRPRIETESGPSSAGLHGRPPCGAVPSASCSLCR
jgi:hypothetical protein